MDVAEWKHTLFGELLFVKELGRSDNAIVKAYLLLDETTVVIKKILSEAGDGVDLGGIREVHALQTLKGCSNILQLIDAEVAVRGDTRLDLMLPYHVDNLEGFYKVIGLEDKVTYFPAVFDQLVIALKHLYDHAILHLDIKPENVLVDYLYDDTTGTVTVAPELYLADFGLSKQVSCMDRHQAMEKFSDVMTPPYRPPEILSEDKYNYKADVWSLGITLLEYLRGGELIDAYNNRNLLRLILRRLKGISEGVLALRSKELLEKLKSGALQITGQIDLTSHHVMSHTLLEALPKTYITMLGKMLEFNQYKRASMDQLMSLVEDVVPSCLDQQHMPARGPVKRGNKFNSKHVYELYDWLIEVAKEYGYDARTFVNTTDLIDRYIANNAIERKSLRLLGVASMMIACKALSEDVRPLNKWAEITERNYTANQVQEHEALVLKRMNYLTSSCDIDPLVSVLNEHGKDQYWNDLSLLYEELLTTGKTFGAFSYEELATIVEGI